MKSKTPRDLIPVLRDILLLATDEADHWAVDMLVDIAGGKHKLVKQGKPVTRAEVNRVWRQKREEQKVYAEARQRYADLARQFGRKNATIMLTEQSQVTLREKGVKLDRATIRRRARFAGNKERA